MSVGQTQLALRFIGEHVWCYRFVTKAFVALKKKGKSLVVVMVLILLYLLHFCFVKPKFTFKWCAKDVDFYLVCLCLSFYSFIGKCWFKL